MCGYESIAGPKWLVVGDSEPHSDATSPEQIEFEKIFCTNCYLSAQLPVQTENGPLGESSILASPVVEKSMLALRFEYRMRTPANLLVILIHENDYAEKKFDRSVLIRKIDRVTVGNLWTTVRLKLGAHILHNYRVLFSLERIAGQPLAPMVNIDNIQFFESDFECAVRIDNDMTCTAAAVMPGLESVKMNLAAAVCQRYSTPCDLGLCQNGALCLNKNHIKSHLMASVVLDEDEFTCVCAHGFTGKR